ncbi:hypothetical protein EMEDMD4_70120 [Sinorhizobium medicae]|uniref:Uncharacterized protein n=1 Tax=Sinorhizobium medicae TaxID=110321 RepID=A0A508X5K7_9HYPH|nr:hypothetical protein EMEDMD4_70120 [Sinorhizobium medicae]
MHKSGVFAQRPRNPPQAALRSARREFLAPWAPFASGGPGTRAIPILFALRKGWLKPIFQDRFGAGGPNFGHMTLECSDRGFSFIVARFKNSPNDSRLLRFTWACPSSPGCPV